MKSLTSALKKLTRSRSKIVPYERQLTPPNEKNNYLSTFKKSERILRADRDIGESTKYEITADLKNLKSPRIVINLNEDTGVLTNKRDAIIQEFGILKHQQKITDYNNILTADMPQFVRDLFDMYVRIVDNCERKSYTIDDLTPIVNNVFNNADIRIKSPILKHEITDKIRESVAHLINAHNVLTEKVKLVKPEVSKSHIQILKEILTVIIDRYYGDLYRERKRLSLIRADHQRFKIPYYLETKIANSQMGGKAKKDAKKTKVAEYKKTREVHVDSKGVKRSVYVKGNKKYTKRLSKSTGKYVYRSIRRA